MLSKVLGPLARSQPFLSLVFCLVAFANSAAARPLVVNNLASRDLSFISQSTFQELSRLPLGFVPSNVVIDPQGTFAFVASDRDAVSGLSAIFKIDLLTRAIVQQRVISIPGRFVALAITPSGTDLIIVDRHQAHVHVVASSDLSTRFVRRMCLSCDGVNQPLFAAAQVVVTADSRFAHVSVPVDQRISTLDLQSGVEVASRSYGALGSSVPTNSISLFDVAPTIPVIAHPSLGIRGVDMPSGLNFNLPLFPQGLAASEVLTVRFGAELLVIAGEATYESSPDYLKLYHVNSGGILSFPTSESSYTPLFNPLTLEVWSVCRSFPGVAACQQIRIDATNLVNPQASITIVGPSAVSSGRPAFTSDYQTYLHPLPGGGGILVVDALTKQVIGTTAVGSGPAGVF